MTGAPERVWLTNFHKEEYGAKLGRGTVSDLDHGQNPDYPEYIRADLARPMTVADAAKVLLDANIERDLAKSMACFLSVKEFDGYKSGVQSFTAAMRALSEPHN